MQWFTSLKQKKVSTYKKKVNILTVLPKPLSESDILNIFQCNKHLIRVEKKLQQTNGALSFPEF